MKLKALLFAAVTALTFSAQAHSKSDFPYPMALVGHTQVISIPELSVYDRSIVDLMLGRTRINDGDSQNDLRVIAAVRDGRVAYRSSDFPKAKALTRGALIYLASTRSCDLQIYGPCLVYGRRDGIGRAILVATQTAQDGSVQFLQGAFSREGRGHASLSNLTARLQQKTDAKYVVFTYANEKF